MANHFKFPARTNHWTYGKSTIMNEKNSDHTVGGNCAHTNEAHIMEECLDRFEANMAVLDTKMDRMMVTVGDSHATHRVGWGWWSSPQMPLSPSSHIAIKDLEQFKCHTEQNHQSILLNIWISKHKQNRNTNIMYNPVSRHNNFTAHHASIKVLTPDGRLHNDTNMM